MYRTHIDWKPVITPGTIHGDLPGHYFHACFDSTVKDHIFTETTQYASNKYRLINLTLSNTAMHAVTSG